MHQGCFSFLFLFLLPFACFYYGETEVALDVTKSNQDFVSYKLLRLCLSLQTMYLFAGKDSERLNGTWRLHFLWVHRALCSVLTLFFSLWFPLMSLSFLHRTRDATLTSPSVDPAGQGKGGQKNVGNGAEPDLEPAMASLGGRCFAVYKYCLSFLFSLVSAFVAKQLPWEESARVPRL